jgi:hypothetical protein
VESVDSDDDIITYDYLFNFGKPLIETCTS